MSRLSGSTEPERKEAGQVDHTLGQRGELGTGAAVAAETRARTFYAAISRLLPALAPSDGPGQTGARETEV